VYRILPPLLVPLDHDTALTAVLTLQQMRYGRIIVNDERGGTQEELTPWDTALLEKLIVG